MRQLKWGFIPFWQKSEKPTTKPINATVEGVAASGMFRQAFQKRRCLIPSDGFIEWKPVGKDVKQPYHITLTQNRPFYFAGIYEAATEVRPATCALLTTRPNSLLEAIHQPKPRMPIILLGDAAQTWLKAAPITPDELSALAAPFPDEQMQATPIPPIVAVQGELAL